MPVNEALRIANGRQLDLVEIAPNSNPPVCKIVNFGKFNYERQKKEKLAKKHQVTMLIKEIRFNANTEKHDVDFKTRHIIQFLLDGHKVKVCVVYKGRMITHPEIGQKLMADIHEILKEVGKMESPPKMEGKYLIVHMLPDKHKTKLYKEKLAEEEKEEAKNPKQNTEDIPKQETENILKKDAEDIQKKETENIVMQETIEFKQQKSEENKI